MTLRLLLAAVLAGLVGLQREMAGKPVGLRTHALIGLGAALFTMAGVFGFKGGDPARIAAGLVTGIGFLGAGANLHRTSGVIEGLNGGNYLDRGRDRACLWSGAVCDCGCRNTGKYWGALPATPEVLMAWDPQNRAATMRSSKLVMERTLIVI